MRNIIPDLGATSDCLTNNRKKQSTKRLVIIVFLVLLALNFIQFGLIKIALI